MTDEFLTAIAKEAGVPDIARWNSERKSSEARRRGEADDRRSRSLGFTGTPSFAVEGPSGKLETLGFPESPGELESAIDSAS